MPFSNQLPKYRCVILEDEPGHREWLLQQLSNFAELDICGSAEEFDEAYLLIAQTQPEVAFMDIQLIGGDVFQLLNRLKQQGLPIPYIVLTTGYPDYVMTALNDYRQYIVQYLVKPFLENWQQKLRKAVDALVAARLQAGAAPAPPTLSNAPMYPERGKPIFVKHKGNFVQINPEKVVYLEAAGKGEVYVITTTDQLQIDMTLSKLLELLPVENFARISKANVIQLNYVQTINREDRTVGMEVAPQKIKNLGIGDAYYNDLLKALAIR